ncbi:hypothetical protein U9M48_020342 [Paspalum notatum var. saurae]|uniref:Uncharacterized protein n=1 Tax=Paspalum notatum var. saurae TaxID=547442 RepID=A0AAQ3TEL4_PASNO
MAVRRRRATAFFGSAGPAARVLPPWRRAAAEPLPSLARRTRSGPRSYRRAWRSDPPCRRLCRPLQRPDPPDASPPG